MLCTHALDAMHKYSKHVQTDRQRGTVLDYDALPGAIPRVILPLFGVPNPNAAWLKKMQVESSFYSKARVSSYSFTGDSTDKESRAPADLKIAAESILMPTYETLTSFSRKSIGAVIDLNSFSFKVPYSEVTPKEIWTAISSFPEIIAEGATYNNSNEKESEERRVLWNSFANNHSSVPFEVILFINYILIKIKSCFIIICIFELFLFLFEFLPTYLLTPICITLLCILIRPYRVQCFLLEIILRNIRLWI